MKKSGIILLTIGLLFTVVTTLGLIIKERITDPRKIQETQLKIRHQIWEPLIGAIAVITGVGLYTLGLKAKVVKFIPWRLLLNPFQLDPKPLHHM